MAIMLPPEVGHVLNMVGFEWPEGNEDTIHAWSSRWQQYGGDVRGVVDRADSAAAYALEHNAGPAMEAFAASWRHHDGASAVAHDLAEAGDVLGGCLLVVAGAIVVLKVAFIVNLTLLVIQIAEAVAAAVETGGLSLAWIPIARELAELAIRYAINEAINTLLGN